jgi:hypothetical protein
MWETLRGVDPDRLERSCSGLRDSIRFGSGAPGVERAEVFLSSLAFEPHRHDTYALGITTAGVQTFRYRGSRHVCLPGQLHILYPDETHDGAAATGDGFSYRILYLAPALIHEALGGDALPFVADPVQSPTPATRVVASLLQDFDEPLGDLARVEIAVAVADVLRALAVRPEGRRSPIDNRAVELVRDYLTAHAGEQTPAETLEQIYRTLRRLEQARRAIEKGVPLARAAFDAGFADQSHLTRQFKRAYGLTPGRWATALNAALH